MKITEVKAIISEKLSWKIQDIFYICTDEHLFDYYLVYKNHRIKALVSIDSLNRLVSGIWN